MSDEATKSKLSLRANRTASNVFSILPHPVIQELKERCAKSKTPTNKRSVRVASNIFAAFPQEQVKEFKEAFTMIDQNRDGVIDGDDLKDTFASLGRIPADSEIQSMLNEAAGPLNFTMFLSLFGEKLTGTDPESALMNAFKMFDSDAKNYLEEDYIKDLLQNMGDNFTQDEIRQTWKEAPIANGKLDYEKFVRLMKRGKEDD